jgi:hypothetical protein
MGEILNTIWQKMGAHDCTCGDILPELKLAAIGHHTLN